MSWQLSKDVERAFDPEVAIQERRKEAEVLTLLALLVQKCERSTRRWRSKNAARRQRLLTLLALLAQEQRYSVTCFTGTKALALTQVEEEQGRLAGTRRLYQ